VSEELLDELVPAKEHESRRRRHRLLEHLGSEEDLGARIGASVDPLPTPLRLDDEVLRSRRRTRVRIVATSQATSASVGGAGPREVRCSLATRQPVGREAHLRKRFRSLLSVPLDMQREWSTERGVGLESQRLPRYLAGHFTAVNRRTGQRITSDELAKVRQCDRLSSTSTRATPAQSAP